MGAIVFLGRISNELSLSSFLSNVSCGTDAGNGQFLLLFGGADIDTIFADFQGKAQALRKLAVNRWQEYTIRNVLALYRTARESCARNSKSLRAYRSAKLIAFQTSQVNHWVLLRPSSKLCFPCATLYKIWECR